MREGNRGLGVEWESVGGAEGGKSRSFDALQQPEEVPGLPLGTVLRLLDFPHNPPQNFSLCMTLQYLST